jgi:ABC-type multidrug transport system ATPase subunit
VCNGVDRNSFSYSHYIGYVQQDDILMQSMSVKECLIFAARMKLPKEVDKEERVQELLDSLKLNKCADTKIGGPLLKGISGGERKRTSIGVELITNPNLIFLDEPTTGLDSFTATNVIEVLRDLAASGRTVISTIHQPNSEIYEMFDQLLLLSNGLTLYHNSADLAVEHFRKYGYECPHLTNPADYFMNMMSIEAYDEDDDADEDQLQKSRSKIQEDHLQKIEFLSRKYLESELVCNFEDQHPEATILNDDNTYRTNFFVQLWLLFWRSLINMLRIPLSSYVKAITYAALAVLCILVFGQMAHD